MESNLRSEMQRKFRLQPPLSFEQSRTGPKESSSTSRLSKDEEIISSSLMNNDAQKTQLVMAGQYCRQPLASLVIIRTRHDYSLLVYYIIFTLFKTNYINISRTGYQRGKYCEVENDYCVFP